ncbi:MAG TPA: polysaccharide deacetylase family protein [Roseiflexaceae bacterium]|nr:polysaccharide deacetylase family protein [Roseiflexaceae bacterium]HMP40684.1 polysaccharide deacetylase family protein [Roseiflexaceae bacterium]
MHQITISIDPVLLADHAAEITWAWRTLLTGIGYAWCESDDPAAACDIAYSADPNFRPQARIWLRAEPARWRTPATLRLAGVGAHGDWAVPQYAEQPDDQSFIVTAEQQVRIGRDVLFDFFWLTTGQEEASFNKNKHGYLDLADSPYQANLALRRAMASGIGVGLERALMLRSVPPPLPRWPHGRRAAACGTHDVDYPEVVRWLEPLRILARQGVGGLRAAAEVAGGRRNHWRFAEWMRAEERFGLRSAFYFVARKGSLIEYAAGTPDSFYDIRAPQFRELFARLRDAGFEIGMHASYRAYQSTARFAAEKQALEYASGGSILGNRHHYWHLDPHDPEATLLIHEKIGLLYDTSLFHDRYVGWRRASCWPFFPFHQGERRALKTLQIPTAWMDDQAFGARHCNPGEPADILRGLVDRVAAQGGVMCANIHDYVYDDTLFPGWSKLYLALLDDLSARGTFWLATPAQIARHWIDRATALERASHGLGRPIAQGAA